MAWLLLKLVRFYQLVISPWLPNLCRFHPTCSQYAIIALQKYPWYKAIALILWRLLRCHPFSKGGDDPVP